jgi:hypothetical protein
MRAALLLLILVCARCSSGTSDGGSSPDLDAMTGLDAGGGEDAGECLVFTHYGNADALSYFVAQTYLCQCGTGGDASASAGTPCAKASECGGYCCACPTGPKHYVAEICNGTCPDEATACSAALTLSDVHGVVCP